jgi:hypothetical protein
LLFQVPPQVIGEIFKGHSEVLSAPPASENGWNLWDSGEWWMLLAAQSMAVGTVMVRWICQFADPVMATGWVGFKLSGDIQSTNPAICANLI